MTNSQLVERVEKSHAKIEKRYRNQIAALTLFTIVNATVLILTVGAATTSPM